MITLLPDVEERIRLHSNSDVLLKDARLPSGEFVMGSLHPLHMQQLDKSTLYAHMITNATPKIQQNREDDDWEEDDDDDQEGDCGASHVCVPRGSMRGYCILRKGHAGAHFCGLCNNGFF